ncbi:TonB-dependent receptor [Sphingobium lactosutens]|nr:TonB-dependent receptor [Sphingobium lactosutens]
MPALAQTSAQETDAPASPVASITAASIATTSTEHTSATPGGSDGDIVVTAQRRAQSILTVPIAISAVSGEGLTTKGITNSAQLATAVPNLQISSTFGNTQPNFSLRGVSVANEYNSNQVSPIGVYQDDVYLASRSSHGMGLYDLERVEVLRGPQGTLFGRNTTGGAINFITKQPTLHGDNGYIQGGYGNYDTWTAQAGLETTMVDDQLGFRIAGNYARGDGVFGNVYPGGRRMGSKNTLQGRASLRIRPGGGPLDIRLQVYGGYDRGTQGPMFGLLPYRQGLGFFQFNENRAGFNRTYVYGTTANISYEISPELKFTSITNTATGNQHLTQAADGSPLDVLDIDWRSRFHQTSEEARFNYSGDSLKVVAGGFYGYDRVVTNNTFYIGDALGYGVDGGFFQHFRQERRSYALFGQADYNLTSQLVLTAGLRYTWDRSRYRDGYANLFMGSVSTGIVQPVASTVPCDTPPGTCAYDPAARYNLSGRNNALTGRAALSYTFDSGLLIYASYNRGYRSGAFNGGGYTSSAGINYIKPERVNAYEVGAKGRFLDNKLTLSAAGFYYDYINQQAQDTRPGPVSFLVNAPKSESYGGEIEATLRLIPTLTFNGAVGYLHTKYKDLTLQNTNLDGNELPFAPKLTLQGGFDWRVARIADGDITLSPTVAYYSHQFFSPFNSINAVGSPQVNSELQQGKYAKINGTLSWTHENVTLRVWANNITNRKTLAAGLDLRGAGLGYNTVMPAEPRTYGGSVRLSF